MTELIVLCSFTVRLRWLILNKSLELITLKFVLTCLLLIIIPAESACALEASAAECSSERKKCKSWLIDCTVCAVLRRQHPSIPVDCHPKPWLARSKDVFSIPFSNEAFPAFPWPQWERLTATVELITNITTWHERQHLPVLTKLSRGACQTSVYLQFSFYSNFIASFCVLFLLEAWGVGECLGFLPLTLFCGILRWDFADVLLCSL